MLLELAVMSFIGVMVGALGSLLTVLVFFAGKLTVGLFDEYLWLATERYLFQTYR